MRFAMYISAGLLITMLMGCGETTEEYVPPDYREANAWIVNHIRDSAIHGAIIRQHTLYPYHFVEAGGELNGLGEQELRVLAKHYKTNPGSLSIRRGGVSEALYDARVASVVTALTEAGVTIETIQLTDSLPGGDGLPSASVLKIVEGRNSPSTPLYYSDQGSKGGALSGSGGSSFLSQ